MKRYVLAMLASCFSSTGFALFCPNSFTHIELGYTMDQVKSACGEPASQTEQVIDKDNVPQTWDYYLVQSAVNTGPAQARQTITSPAQGTMKTTFAFDASGKIINISANGLGVGETTMCNGISLRLEMTKDDVKNACGQPAMINKAAVSFGTQTKSYIMIFSYVNSAASSVDLIFTDGILTNTHP